MMKKLLLLGIFSYSLISFAQDNSFNRWSIEVNVGMNKPVRPYTDGYYSSNPNKLFDISTINHFDFGTRYMLSEVFGAKLDLGYDKFENQAGSESLAFESIQYRIALQGIVNLGNLMKFNTFSKRFNILGHLGVQVSQFTPKKSIYKRAEADGGIIYGITPQFRITNRLVFTGDFTVSNNIRQHYNWDGATLSQKDNNLSGLLYSTSFGLTFYLGKKDVHADWYVNKDNKSTTPTSDEDARKRITELEKMMNDVDRDGVPDYLDSQNNTPAGLVVDAKGRFIDINKNGVPDELENSSRDGKDDKSNNSIVEQSDAMRSLIKNGYLNIFFDINQDYPNNGSTGNVFQIIQFLKTNLDVKIKLLGYADVSGGEKTNRDLSNRRAQNIFKVLTDSGINKNRITVIAQGVDKSFTNEKENLNLARRVSIVLE